MKSKKITAIGLIEKAHVKGLFFDVDGTLSDSDDLLVERISRYLRPIAVVSKSNMHHLLARLFVMAVETPGNWVYSLVDRLGFDHHFIRVFLKISSRKDVKRNNHHDKFWIISGVENMLAALSANYKLAVVSARDEKSTLEFLEHFGLRKYFDIVVTSQTREFTKPFPDPVEFAANYMALHPSECIMIGDTVVDILAGKDAGTQTVGVLCGFGTKKELQRAGADLIISSTAVITDILMG